MTTAVHNHQFEDDGAPCTCGMTHAEVLAAREACRIARAASRAPYGQMAQVAMDRRRDDLNASRRDRRQWGNGR